MTTNKVKIIYGQDMLLIKENELELIHFGEKKSLFGWYIFDYEGNDSFTYIIADDIIEYITISKNQLSLKPPSVKINIRQWINLLHNDSTYDLTKILQNEILLRSLNRDTYNSAFILKELCVKYNIGIVQRSEKFIDELIDIMETIIKL